MKKLLAIFAICLLPVMAQAESIKTDILNNNDLGQVFTKQDMNPTDALILSSSEMKETEGAYGLPGAFLGGLYGGGIYLATSLGRPSMGNFIVAVGGGALAGATGGYLGYAGVVAAGTSSAVGTYLDRFGCFLSGC